MSVLFSFADCNVVQTFLSVMFPSVAEKVGQTLLSVTFSQVLASGTVYLICSQQANRHQNASETTLIVYEEYLSIRRFSASLVRVRSMNQNLTPRLHRCVIFCSS